MRSQQGEEEQGNITSYKECEKRYILSKWGAVGGGEVCGQLQPGYQGINLKYSRYFKS